RHACPLPAPFLATLGEVAARGEDESDRDVPRWRSVNGQARRCADLYAVEYSVQIRRFERVALDKSPRLPQWPRLTALRCESSSTVTKVYRVMAKPTTVKIKLVSSADTGFFYVTKKNPRTQTEKMSFRKYDPVVRKHVEFKEAKIK
ncbi:MAG: hypothetical protein RIQ68_1443, partial [Pseudomonadota bacterium]